MGEAAAGASPPFAPPWPCAAASPVVANKAAVATESRKLFFILIFLLQVQALPAMPRRKRTHWIVCSALGTAGVYLRTTQLDRALELINGQGTVTEKNWAGVTVKWDSRAEQAILHNDMVQVERAPTKIM